MTDLDQVRTAVVGCGYWGWNLVRDFAARSDLRVCCDVSGEARNRVEKQYPDIPVTASYQDVLEDPHVEAVVLVTPAERHADMAVEALAARKHVYVEKPLALSLRDGERVLAAAEEAERILMVGHLLEYHPAVEYLKTLIERGDLGEVYYFYSQRLNLGKVRSQENALWSLASHDISMVLYLLGEEPTEVLATGQAFLQIEIEDVTFVTLKFSSGRVAQIHVSWLDPHKERRLTVVGSKKMAVFDDMEPREKIKIYDKGFDRRSTDTTAVSTKADVLAVREGDILIPLVSNNEPLAVQCAAFLRAVRSGIPPRTDGLDGLRVLRVLEAAQNELTSRRMLFPAGV